MPVRRGFVLAAALLALAAAPAAGQSYLPKGSGPDATRYLPPPPVLGSPADKLDHAAFRATRRLKDGDRWVLATSDVQSSPAAMLADFSCAVGVKLDAANAPTLLALLNRANKDLRSVVDPPKDLYRRKRPFVGTRLPICVPVDDSLIASGSYPSGHSTTGWTVALILAELAPDRATEILTRGRVFGESRVVCGVHYPSDIEAGRTNASALVAALHSSPEFRADMDRARAELAAVRQAAAAQPDPAQCRLAEAAAARQPW